MISRKRMFVIFWILVAPTLGRLSMYVSEILNLGNLRLKTTISSTKPLPQFRKAYGPVMNQGLITTN